MNPSRLPPFDALLDAPHRTGPVREVTAFLEAPLRRPLLVIAPLVLVTAAAVALTFVLSKRYQSLAVILIESQKAPDVLARGSDDSSKPKIITIRQELLTRVRLERIIRELNPYPKMATRPLHVVVDEMRNAVQLTQKGSDTFEVAYENADPQMAMQVLNRLVSLFVEETNEARTEQVEGTADFLETQLQEARKQLEDKDQEIRSYKEANLGRLPEQMSGNLGILQRLQAEKQSLLDNLRLAREKQALLERGLVSEAFAADTVPRSLSAELKQLNDQLADLRTRDTDEHPDVQALLARIARLKARLAEQARTEGAAAVDPARAQLLAAKAEVTRLEAEGAEIDKRIDEVQRRVDAAPRVEQGLANLTRDYVKINDNYVDLFKKKQDADMAKRLEQRWRSERYRVLERAYLPEVPSFPKPWLFALLGAILGLGSGLGAAVLAEYLDHSVKGLRELEANVPIPVLAVLPDIDGQRMGQRRRTAHG
jgi:succinoglycan biosynthesis transport protein ExoP